MRKRESNLSQQLFFSDAEMARIMGLGEDSTRALCDEAQAVYFYRKRRLNRLDAVLKYLDEKQRKEQVKCRN